MKQKQELLAATRKVTAEEAKHFLENVEHYRLEKWMSQIDLAKKIYRNNNAKVDMLNAFQRYKNGAIPTIDTVEKIAKALDCTAEILLAPPINTASSFAVQDFNKEVVRKNLKGLSAVVKETNIPLDRLKEVIYQGIGKFNQNEISALLNIKFSLPTLAPFADNQVNFMELSARKLVGPLSQADLTWYYQRKALSLLRADVLPRTDLLAQKTNIPRDILQTNILLKGNELIPSNLSQPAQKEWQAVLKALGAAEMTESQLELMGKYSLNQKQMNELIQAETIFQNYAKTFAKGESINEKVLYDFYLSLKQRWSNTKSGQITKDTIKELISNLTAKSIWIGSALFVSLIKSAPVAAAEILAEELEIHMDNKALVASWENRPQTQFFNRLGAHLMKNLLLIPKAINGALSTSILGDNPPYTLLDLPPRIMDNFFNAQGYSKSIVNDWRDFFKLLTNETKTEQHSSRSSNQSNLDPIDLYLAMQSRQTNPLSLSQSIPRFDFLMDKFQGQTNEIKTGSRTINAVDTSKAEINCFNDEYDKNIYISPANMEIAIKSVGESLSPYKEGLYKAVSSGIHSISSAMTMIHMSGKHLHGPIKYVGPCAEICSEILHNSSNDFVEKIVCGTGIGIMKEVINSAVAAECGVVVGTLSSLATTPIGGLATMGVTAAGAYKLTNKITTPLAHWAENQCHTMFTPANLSLPVSCKVLNSSFGASELTCGVTSYQSNTNSGSIGKCTIKNNIDPDHNKSSSNTPSILSGMGFSQSSVAHISNMENRKAEETKKIGVNSTVDHHDLYIGQLNKQTSVASTAIKSNFAKTVTPESKFAKKTTNSIVNKQSKHENKSNVFKPRSSMLTPVNDPIEKLVTISKKKESNPAFLTGSLLEPKDRPKAATAFNTGHVIMHKSQDAARIAQQNPPIIVDTTLDKFSNLHSSAASFVQSASQKFSSDYSNNLRKTYADPESLMLAMGYSEHVEKIYKHLSENQRLIYATVTRDLFNEKFKLNPDGSVQVDWNVSHNNHKGKTDDYSVAEDIQEIEKKIQQTYTVSAEYYADQTIKEQNKKLQAFLPPLVKDANKNGITTYSNHVEDAQQFCDVLYATGQGVALVSQLTGNNRLAKQVTQSAMGMSQIIMGVSQIAANGWAAGPVGMALGGINMLISCFGSDDDGNEAMEALAQQLAIMSQQIHALHEDMLEQFSRVFTALGVINTNIIEGFKHLHENQQLILTNLAKLQKDVTALQTSINTVGSKIDKLGSELHGHFLDEDRKQLALKINEVQEKTKRSFNRLKLHPKVMTAFKTFNEQVIIRKINAEKPTTEEITKSLTTSLGSAEANTGLLLNFAKNNLEMDVKLPIADPAQWQQCTDLLIEMVDKLSEEKGDLAAIGEQDYEDFAHLQTIGENWLDFIRQFQTKADQNTKFSLLFHHYRQHLTELVSLIKKEVAKAEEEASSLIPAYQGDEEYNKQEAFKYEFKQNSWYQICIQGFGWGRTAQELWDLHIANRKKDITNKLTTYKRDLYANFRIKYLNESKALPLFKEPTVYYFPRTPASVFMTAEVASETMPLLPLPCAYNGWELTPTLADRVIPSIFTEAEALKLGKIKHSYQYVDNEFIYKIRFHPTNNEQAVLIRQYNKACTLPSYLNPAEAAWYAYMGGEYPSDGSYNLVLYHYSGTYSAHPKMATFDGLRKYYEVQKEIPTVTASTADEELLANKVEHKKRELRLSMNERIIQELESLDSRSVLAATMMEVDASAKVLLAFLSILFREYYQRPPIIMTRTEIMELAKHYRGGQHNYLTHQLAESLKLLNKLEELLLKQLNEQMENAYTPVRETLVQLEEFMETYKPSVVPDEELVKVKKEKFQSENEAMSYSAAQMAFKLQTELLNSGHIEAAIHISNFIKQQNFDFSALCQPKETTAVLNPSAKLGFRRQQLFSRAKQEQQAKPSIDSSPEVSNTFNPSKSIYESSSLVTSNIPNTFNPAQIQRSRILCEASHLSEQEYIEIPSFADHNCCFNSFALGLMDLVHQNHQISNEAIQGLIQAFKKSQPVLEKRLIKYENEIHSFIKPLGSWIDFLEKSPSSQDFINYIYDIKQYDQASFAAIEFALAPALREIAVTHHLQKVNESNFGEFELNDASQLKKDEAWAGHESLHALAEIFQVNIDIKQYHLASNQDCFKTASGLNNQLANNPAYPTLTMLNINKKHWNYLIPKEQQAGFANLLPASSSLVSENEKDPSPKTEALSPAFFSRSPSYLEKSIECMKEKKYKEALEFGDMAIKSYISLKGKYSIEVGGCYSTLASCYQAMGEKDSAIQCCESAIEQFNQAKNITQAKRMFSILSVQRKLNDLKKQTNLIEQPHLNSIPI